jgi:hypothetical protein
VVQFATATDAALFASRLYEHFNLSTTQVSVATQGTSAVVTFHGGSAAGLETQLLDISDAQKDAWGITSLSAASDDTVAPSTVSPTANAAPDADGQSRTEQLLLYILAPIGGILLLVGVVVGVSVVVRKRKPPVVHFRDVVRWEELRRREMAEELRGLNDGVAAAFTPRHDGADRAPLRPPIQEDASYALPEPASGRAAPGSRVRPMDDDTL